MAEAHGFGGVIRWGRNPANFRKIVRLEFTRDLRLRKGLLDVPTNRMPLEAAPETAGGLEFTARFCVTFSRPPKRAEPLFR